MKLNKSGFSLLELLIVIAIIGILTLSSIMSFSETIFLKKTRIGADRVAHTLNRARFIAILNNKKVGVYFENKNFMHSFFIFEDKNKNNRFDSNDTRLTEDESLETGLNIIAKFRKPYKHLTIFNPNGTAKGGSICVSGKKSEYRISVAIITGKVGVYEKC